MAVAGRGRGWERPRQETGGARGRAGDCKTLQPWQPRGYVHAPGSRYRLRSQALGLQHGAGRRACFSLARKLGAVLEAQGPSRRLVRRVKARGSQQPVVVLWGPVAIHPRRPCGT